MKTNQQFKNEALAALRGNWGKAVLITLLYLILAGAITGSTCYQNAKMQTYMKESTSSLHSVRQMAALAQDPEYQLMVRDQRTSSGFMLLLEIFILLPFSVGYVNALRKLLSSGDADLVHNTLSIATNKYWHKVWGMLWMTILTSLWCLLFLIPGIIKAFAYAMTPYILEENPELSASQAIHRSRMMMRGHKFDLFWLELSFIGWAVLATLTAGIGFFWLIPYIQTSQAAFYEEMKAEYALNGGLD